MDRSQQHNGTAKDILLQHRNKIICMTREIMGALNLKLV